MLTIMYPVRYTEEEKNILRQHGQRSFTNRPGTLALVYDTNTHFPLIGQIVAISSIGATFTVEINGITYSVAKKTRIIVDKVTA